MLNGDWNGESRKIQTHQSGDDMLPPSLPPQLRDVHSDWWRSTVVSFSGDVDYWHDTMEVSGSFDFVCSMELKNKLFKLQVHCQQSEAIHGIKPNGGFLKLKWKVPKKSSIWIGFSIINHPIYPFIGLGYPHFKNPPPSCSQPLQLLKASHVPAVSTSSGGSNFWMGTVSRKKLVDRIGYHLGSSIFGGKIWKMLNKNTQKAPSKRWWMFLELLNIAMEVSWVIGVAPVIIP